MREFYILLQRNMYCSQVWECENLSSQELINLKEQFGDCLVRVVEILEVPNEKVG